jgi:hypothetical protein
MYTYMFFYSLEERSNYAIEIILVEPQILETESRTDVGIDDVPNQRTFPLTIQIKKTTPFIAGMVFLF